MRSRKRLNLALAGLCLCAAPEARADKLDFMAGYYSLSASNSAAVTTTTAASSTAAKGDGKLSALASYRITYRHGLLHHFELDAGYSLLMSQTLGGSMGYGLDLGGSWFPFTDTQAYSAEAGGNSIEVTEIWRPYTSLTFNQRQFEGASSAFSGFGIGFGTERSLTDRFSLKGEVRYLSLSSSTISATYIDFLVGVALTF